MTPEQIQGHNLAINAKVIACQIHCEAMKAENAIRERGNYALAYEEQAFADLATEVERLAASFIST